MAPLLAALLAGCVAAPVAPGPTQPTPIPSSAPLPSVALSPARPAADDVIPVLDGTVLSVTDGDTIRVHLGSGSMAVRSHSIDAPENDQPWGPEARAALVSRLDRRQVELEVSSQDQYERLVATVRLGDQHINAWMVQEGHAWAYREYMKDPMYCHSEADARSRHLGLWSLGSANIHAPWEWRAHRRDSSKGFTDYGRETASNCIAAMNGRGSPRRSAAAPVPAPLQSTANAGCLIKGNVSQNGRIYHVPGSRSYDRTNIDESKGERWFCTEAEARVAGWRAPR